jgi:hypothetical protein
MKNLFATFKVWDGVCIILICNALLFLFLNIFVLEKPSNADVIEAMVHCLILLYTYKYFTNRKTYL